ncbi:aa3-type cytochrome c oxidase subunit IV [Lichenibacterium dinghuense]|nr:aa3-type cytochrome c oxidase subunit IV [Lichenibacterium sp. 6Y81]
MAIHDDVPMNPEYMDYAEHERTYSGFINVTKWGVVAVAALLIFLALFVM